jgi:hypothetical protein
MHMNHANDDDVAAPDIQLCDENATILTHNNNNISIIMPFTQYDNMHRINELVPFAMNE